MNGIRALKRETQRAPLGLSLCEVKEKTIHTKKALTKHSVCWGLGFDVPVSRTVRNACKLLGLDLLF